MIQLLSGENNYEIRQRRAQIIAEFREGKTEDAITVVDGTTMTIDELPQLLMGASLFAPERLIVIDDAHGQKVVWEKLAEYLPQVGEGTDVVLVAGAADKRTKTYKWLQKNAEVIAKTAPNEAQLVSWVQNEARAAGIEIAPNVARYLVEFTTGDQWQLAGDIQKLALSGQAVTPELIRDLLIPNPASSAFDLLDAALAGQATRINQLLDGVRSHEDPYRFFGLLASQVFAILVVSSAGDRPADTIARDSGLHPFVVRKSQPLARRLSSHDRTRMAQLAATTDMQLKSSGIEPWVLITTLLKNISSR